MSKEQTKPKYYHIKLKGITFDVFDLVRVINVSFELASALKYTIRIKGDKAKRINDLQKAKECIDREIKFLETTSK